MRTQSAGALRRDWPPGRTSGASKAITDAIDKHVDNEQHQDDDDGAAGVLSPVA
jgi:hypothetical protein